MLSHLFQGLLLLTSLQQGLTQLGPCTVGSDCEIGCQEVELPNNLTFHCRVSGPETGVGVVLLHGFPTWSVFWNPLMKSWVRSFKNLQAVACDLRGYSPGARPEHIANYSYEAQIEDVLGIADHFNFTRFHLVGHDHGSGLGWTFAKMHPGRLYSYTAMSVPHPDAWSRLLYGANADEEQQAMMQYVPAWAPPDSASKGAAALMQYAGFTDPADWQKPLWTYNAVFGHTVAMPPVLDNATMASYENHTCCGSGSLVASSVQAAGLSPNTGAPQASAMGAVDVPVTFVCGTRDKYLKCWSPDIISNGGQVYSSMDYAYVPVDCGHDLAAELGPEACSSRVEQNKVFRAVTQMIERHSPALPTPAPSPIAPQSETPPVDLSTQYPRKQEAILPNFNLYWEVNSTHLRIGIAAKTEGWVGFGITEDTSGSMIGSDIVMAMVDQNGSVTVSDRHAIDFAQPLVDCHQDWEAVSGERLNGWTFVHLSRLLDTQDGEDRPFVENGRHGERIIVAYSESANFAAYHVHRIGTSIWAFRSANVNRDPLAALRADPSILQVEVRATPSNPLSRPYFIQTIYESGGSFIKGFHDHTAAERCSGEPYRYCCINPRNASTDRRLQDEAVCQICSAGGELLRDRVAGYSCCRDQLCSSLIETEEATENEAGCFSAGGVAFHPYTCGALQGYLTDPECPDWLPYFTSQCCGGSSGGSGHYLDGCPACMDGTPVPAARDSYVDICFGVNDLFPDISAANGEEWHVVGFEGIIDSIQPHDTSSNVHHMTLDAYADASCSRSIFGDSGAGPTLFAWVPGQEGFAMPDEAGFTISAPYTSEPPEVTHSRIMSVGMNLHYDNRYLNNNHALDNSGIRMYISRTKRRYNAGVLQLADPTIMLSGQTIPAGQESLGKLESTCPGACTNFFTEPIHIFYHFMHMHGNGIAMYNDFYRAGSRYSRAGAVDWYDYTLETAATEIMTVMPGDEIRTSCYFNSRQRRESGVGYTTSSSVIFGLEATDEMCISWLNYYPEQEHSVCGLASDCHAMMPTAMHSLEAATQAELSSCRTWPGQSSCGPGAGTQPPASRAPELQRLPGAGLAVGFAVWLSAPRAAW